MGAIPTTMGGSWGAHAQEGGVTVSGVGLTQYPASAQHHGRQRRGTGPPSRAELSPALLGSAPASQAPSTRRDLGTWGRRGVSGCGMEHPSLSLRRVPIRGTLLPPLSGSLCRKARGNTRPGPSRATLRGHEHQLCWRHTHVPSSYRATLQGRDPGDPGTHRCRFGLSQENPWLTQPFTWGSQIWDSP